MAAEITYANETGIHAAIYGRQSERRENGSEVSTAIQLSVGIQEAERRNAESIKVYEDLGISAFTGVERPDFDRLLNDCRAGKINVLIVYYVSRLFRIDPMEAIPIIFELFALDITIVSITEGEFRRGNLPDLIHLFMRVDGAHQESRTKSVAVSDAKRVARELGGYTGGKPPYGFEMHAVTRTYIGDDGKERPIVIQLLRPNKAEVKIIRAAWKKAKENMGRSFNPSEGAHHPGSLNGICAEMNATDVPTRGKTVGKEREDSAWDPKVLKRVFTDPRIAGYDAEVIYKLDKDGRKTSVIERYEIKRDPETMEPIQRYEPAIPPDEWWIAKEWAESRGSGIGLSRGQALLTSLSRLYCECGKPKKSARTENANKANYRCSRPRGRRKPGQHEGDCCISQSALDDYVVRRIFALIQTSEGDAEAAAVLAEAARRFAARHGSPAKAGERQTLTASRKDDAEALQRLYDDREAGGYSGDIGRQRFVQREKHLNDQIEAATERLKKLEEMETPTLPISQWLPEDPKEDPVGEKSWWAGASIEDRRDFITFFIDRITISKSPSKKQNQWSGSKVSERAEITFARPKEGEEKE